MDVLWHPEARSELRGIPAKERIALLHAVEKLVAIGLALGDPHSSAVRGAASGLRELRPRRGRSPWRAFYRRIGSRFVIGSVGPEANVDPRGFAAAVAAAQQRLDEVEGD